MDETKWGVIVKVLSATLTICCLLLLAESAYSQKSNYAILVQESPVGAGSITPGLGMHSFGENETITLNTVPKPGYHFVYWLGDVSEPTKNRTTLSINGPKIVIAVFERDSYELSASATAATGNSPTYLTPRHHNISSASFSGGSGKPPNPTPPPGPPPIDPPPEPVPEPTTIVILAVGACCAISNKRKHLKTTTSH
ncbi:MAG: PEP-CTERM sorting domain-containing protein [Anaerohalosphaeraceae bacterium]|nr:PEP-CTERM sorting domain-containing protein [Anaerohalosphaeraceae bacterium]